MDDAGVAACVAGLQAFSALPPEERALPRYKGIRTLLFPLLDELRGRFNHGKGSSDVREEHAERRFRHAKRQREQGANTRSPTFSTHYVIAQDASLLNSRVLRARRLDRLAELTESTGVKGLIPDGTVETPDDPAAPSPSLLIEDVCDVADSPAAPQSSSVAAGSPAPSASDEVPLLNTPRSCYTCRGRFRELHFFYDALCPPCAKLNYSKRLQTARLDGRIAIVTGARVKIGYQTALRLLRAGATVIATTRFPVDASTRFAAEKDADQWQSRLQIVGLDFRDVLQVERFALFAQRNLPHLDIIINNACQTIRRPAGFYEHLLSQEKLDNVPEAAAPFIGWHQKLHAAAQLEAAAPGASSPSASSSLAAVNPSAALSQLALLPDDHGRDEALFPSNALDTNSQQIDLRRHNSWLMTLAEVSTPELLEVMTINAVAPFILNAKLKELLLRSPHTARYIINVSAMEGKFYRHKSPCHPHTNMAKAALNMLTRTSADEYAQDRIYMNAVDTGWINDEKPLEASRRHADNHNFQTPLDEVDAMARILDPIMVGENEGVFLYGKFLKDFAETEW